MIKWKLYEVIILSIQLTYFALEVCRCCRLRNYASMQLYRIYRIKRVTVFFYNGDVNSCHEPSKTALLLGFAILQQAGNEVQCPLHVDGGGAREVGGRRRGAREVGVLRGAREVGVWRVRYTCTDTSITCTVTTHAQVAIKSLHFSNIHL